MSELKHPTLTAALAAFQADIPTVAKGNTATVNSQKGSYSYEYSDLSDVTGIALPLLGKQGLAWSTSPTLDSDYAFVLKYELRHESGESITGMYPLPVPSTPAQTLGAAITYARRYTLCAVTGIAPGGDDEDGPPSAVKPSEDWHRAIRDAGTVQDLHLVAERLKEAKEGTRALRDAYAARLGFLQRQEVTDDGDAGEQPADASETEPAPGEVESGDQSVR